MHQRLRSTPACASHTLAPVIDLRSRLPSAYALELAPRADVALALQMACDSLRAIGFGGPLQITPPESAHADLAGWSNAVHQASGLAPAAVDVVVCERALQGMAYTEALATLEKLRARGHGIALLLDETPGFPLAARGRAIVTEVRVDADLTTRRDNAVYAARETGIAVTALNSAERSDSALLRCGYDRRL